MAGYLVSHFKSQYRILPVIDISTNEFARNYTGEIDEDNVYIACKYDVMIWHYGGSKLMVYVPSKVRGRNYVKNLEEIGVKALDYDETDYESTFKINASDIDSAVAILRPKTNGAKISPFSSKNLPKAQVDIPENELSRYKSLVSKLGTGGMSVIRTANKKFLDEVLAKKLRPKGRRKPFDYKSDMKSMCLSRDTKAYIYKRGLWEEYLKFLEIAIDTYLNK